MRYTLLEQDIWKCAECETEQTGAFPARCSNCGSATSKIWQLSLVRVALRETNFIREVANDICFSLRAIQPFILQAVQVVLLYIVLMNPFSVSIVYWLSEYRLETGMPAWHAFLLVAGYGFYAAGIYALFRHLYLMIVMFCRDVPREARRYAYEKCYGSGRLVVGE